MTLKYQVESLDGIDEAAHGFYEQGDNGYTLKVEGVVPQSRFDEVNQKSVDNATEAARRRKTLERVTGKLGLESADGLDDALGALLSKSTAPKKDDDAQKTIVEQIKATAEAEKAELQKQITAIKMEGAATQLQGALVEVGFPAKAAQMFASASLNRVQLDDSGKLVIMSDKGAPLAGSGADGFAVMGDLAKELAAAMPDLLVDTGKGGGGKPPASGSNAGAKTVTRSQFDAMSQAERADFSKSGGKVVNG